MNKIKILYIIDTLEFYGAERSLTGLAKEYKSINPVFVHVYSGDALKQELTKNNIMVYSLNIQQKYGFKKARQLLSRIYLFEKPDLVHSTLFRSDLLARKLKTQFQHIPLINSWVTNSYTCSRYRDKNVIYRLKLWRVFLMDLFSADKVDCFLANSHTIENNNRLALRIPKNKTKVIYRGRQFSKFNDISKVKLNLLKDKLSLEGKRILLNVGRLIPSKGQLELIQIMPSLIEKYPDIILLICGEGKYRKILEKEIFYNQLENHVKLLGARNDIPELLRIANYFVFPSHLEGLSGSLIEAMIAGKIIVASDIPENLECIDEKTALIFRKGNKKDLASNLNKVLEKPHLYKILGERAQKVAQLKFDISIIARQYENFYKEIFEEQYS